MPEILEIEAYRRSAEGVVGRRVLEVDLPDVDYAKGVGRDTLQGVLGGACIERVERHGKVLVLETTSERLGLRFGMTGRLLIDGIPTIEALEYSSRRLDPAWNRFGLRFDEGSLVINDPRRLGSVALAPDLSALGPDAWAIDATGLAQVLRSTRMAVKAALLDQSKIAGLGNLLTDELLWRSAIAPSRRSDELVAGEVATLADELAKMLPELDARGGSTEGDHMPLREHDQLCPVEGHAMAHATIGGRSTWWCPGHQR